MNESLLFNSSSFTLSHIFLLKSFSLFTLKAPFYFAASEGEDGMGSRIRIWLHFTLYLYRVLGTVGAKEAFGSCPGNQLLITTLDVCRSIKKQLTNACLEHTLHLNICVYICVMCDTRYTYTCVYIYTHICIYVYILLKIIVFAPLEK